MMSVEAKLTSKGQITVPLKIRKELGVKVGDKIKFDKNSNDEIVLRPGRKESPFAKYRGILKRGKGLTREEVVRNIREMRDGK